MELKRLESMDKLDVEYLKVLSIIKPYVTCIMDNSYIEMVKLWLEKLSNDGRIDKMIRNQYLLHLGKQIQRGMLDYPFHLPPSERLDPIEERVKEVDSEDMNLVLSMKKCAPGRKRRLRRSVFTPKSEDGFSDSSWQDLSDESVVNYAAGDSPKPPNSYTKPRDQQDMKKMMVTIEKLRAENATLNQIVQNRKSKGKEKLEIQQIVSEIQVLKSRLHELLNIKTALQSSHSSLTSEWQNAVSSLNKKLSGLQKRNGELRNIIHQLEVKLNENLKKNCSSPQKFVNLNEMHKKEIEVLKQKHQEEMNKQETKFSELLKEKCSDVSAKFSDLQEWYGKQLEENHASMKEFYDKQIEECGSKIREECELTQDKMRKEFEDRQTSRDKYYEAQLEEVRCQHEKEIKFKDGEIERLELLLQEQCKRMQEEVQTIRNQLQAGVSSDENNNEKVIYLQKCVTKLDKMYRKAEKEFAKQLLKLRREMDMREKHSQILMGTQRVNLISASNVAKQKEIDEVIGKLEQHYIELLTEQQKEAFEQRRNDQKTIAELKTELAYLKANF